MARHHCLATRCRCLLFLLLPPLLGGQCDPKRYHVLTRVTDEGQVERDILQPVDESLPPEVLVGGKWSSESKESGQSGPETQTAEKSIDEAEPEPELAPVWKDRWSKAGFADPPENAWEGRYIRATGAFPHASRIPRNYHLIVPGMPQRASINRIEHDRIDYVLFACDTWRETITETIRLDEYVEALDELIADVLPVLRATMDELIGEEYDLTALHERIADEGATAVRRYFLANYEHEGLSLQAINVEEIRHLQAILRGIRFELPLTESANAVDTDAMEAAIETYLVGVFQRHVVLRSTGQKLTREQAGQLLKRIKEIGNSSGDGSRGKGNGGQVGNDRFETVFRRHLLAIHGEAYTTRAMRLLARIGGAHGGPIRGLSVGPFAEGRAFRYAYKAPGPILETNGRLLGMRRVVWEFSHDDMFPHGYTMNVRSLVRWPDAERRLYGQELLDDRGRIDRLIKHIPDAGPVRDALEQAVRQETKRPLEELLNAEQAATRMAARVILDAGANDSDRER